MPFLFRSVDHMHQVLDGPIGEEVLAAMEPHGLIGLAFYDSGSRSLLQLQASDQHGRRPQGHEAPGHPVRRVHRHGRGPGGNPTPMPFGEVFSAIQTGVVDGAENNWPSYWSTRHFEVAKFYSLTEHSMTPEMLVMSKMTWDTLTPEDQRSCARPPRSRCGTMRELWQESESQGPRGGRGRRLAGQRGRQAAVHRRHGAGLRAVRRRSRGRRPDRSGSGPVQ